MGTTLPKHPLHDNDGHKGSSPAGPPGPGTGHVGSRATECGRACSATSSLPLQQVPTGRLQASFRGSTPVALPLALLQGPRKEACVTVLLFKESKAPKHTLW